MAISARNAGSWAYAASGTTQTITLPTHSTGDMLLVRYAIKTAAISTTTLTCGTTGWTKLGQYANGTTNSGNGTGSVLLGVFYKVATSSSETNPVITSSATIAQAGGVAIAYQKGASESWSTPVGAGGPDTTSGTSHSATIASHISCTTGDLIDFFTGICDDTTMTVPTFTQASATLNAVVEYPATAGIDTSGSDGAYDGGYRTVASGTSSAAAVVTGTLTTSETGTSWTTRLRVYTPETKSGTFTTTGGGVVAATTRKDGKTVITGTGGGVAAASTQKGGSLALTTTGGGVAALVYSKGTFYVLSTTGGGVIAIAYERSAPPKAATYALTTTGGGVLSLTSTTSRYSILAATGSGGVAFVPISARLTAIGLTGGGATSLQTISQRRSVISLTGGGSATQKSVKGASSTLTATGSGSATQASLKGALSALTATGGGTLAILYTTALTGDDARYATLTVTGSGEVSLDLTTNREATLALAGGGAIQIIAVAAVPLFVTHDTGPIGRGYP